MFAVPASEPIGEAAIATSQKLSASSVAKPAASPIEEHSPQYVSVDCRVCQTRLTGTLAQVGKELKCPDCGARTILPAPPKPKPKQIPAAMEGEQYELWGVDEQPLPSDLIKSQPKYVAVGCRLCQSLMQATLDQIGKTIVCPDCGTKNVVPPPPKQKPKKSVLSSDAETPKLDPASDPGERPVFVPPRRKMAHEERQEAEYQRALEKSRRTGKPMEIDFRGRPVLPRWPLVTGIIPFLFSQGVPGRWFALSSGLIASVLLVVTSVEDAMQGAGGAFIGMCFLALGSILTMICAAATASALLAIVTESSEGNREIQYWPGVHDWFGDLLVVAVGGMVSAFPGWLVSRFAATGPEEVGLWIAGSIFVCLPLILMSQLDVNSPWDVLSGRVLASLARCPFSWLLFYLELAAIAAACGAVTFFSARQDPKVAIWFTPLYVASLILVARLLGRLGWRLAEAMTIIEQPDDKPL
jgi:DNA-directed RNA polymerase subunit RPC12/RpoP